MWTPGRYNGLYVLIVKICGIHLESMWNYEVHLEFIGKGKVHQISLLRTHRTPPESPESFNSQNMWRNPAGIRGALIKPQPDFWNLLPNILPLCKGN